MAGSGSFAGGELDGKGTGGVTVGELSQVVVSVEGLQSPHASVLVCGLGLGDGVEWKESTSSRRSSSADLRCVI